MYCLHAAAGACYSLEFQHALELWGPGQRNTTTWSAFQRQVDGGGDTSACAPREAPGP